MRFLLGFLCFIPLVGCGEEATYVTKQGVEVFLTKGVFENAVVFSQFDSILSDIRFTGPWNPHTVRETLDDRPPRVEIVPSVFYVGEVLVSGVFYIETNKIRVANITPRCLVKTAFVHEMLHYFNWHIDNEADFQHTSYLFSGDFPVVAALSMPNSENCE